MAAKAKDKKADQEVVEAPKQVSATVQSSNGNGDKAPRILDEFPSTGRRGTTAYPWNEWMDGQIRELVKDVHFGCTIASFQAQAHAIAHKEGMKVKTAKSGENAIIIGFYNVPED